jgi:CAAX prenyl protease-like protein
MTAQQQKPPTHHGAGTTTTMQAPGFFARASSARILPFAVYMAFIAIADLLERVGVQAGPLRWLYPVKAAAVVIVLFAYRRYYTELAWRTMRPRHVAEAIAVGVIVLVLWINLSAAWMQIGSAAGYDPTGPDGRIDWFLVACRIAGAALVVPVMEELFWRSFLLRWLEQRDFLHVYPASVGLQSLAVTVVLFGFEHNLWLAGIVAGIAYSALYMRSRNLWSAILAHAVTNGLLGVWVVASANWTYW